VLDASAASRPPLARAPIIGAVFGLLLVLSPIMLGAHGILLLFSLGALVIVVGGVIAVAFMSYDAADVGTALAAIAAMFRAPPATDEMLRRDMANLVRWAGAIKDRRMLNFEARIGDDEIADPFVKYGLNMVLSEYPANEVRGMLETAADACQERDSNPVDILQAMASHAPAFGMVGTLVGMVALLSNLGDDLAGIAPSLAVAFLSTLYGVVSARMIYMPAAARLRHEVAARRFRHHLVSEGMAMLVGQRSPMQVQDRLNSFLRPESHDYFDCIGRKAKPEAAPRLKVVAQ
jgi:chemotaxis protein MotA